MAPALRLRSLDAFRGLTVAAMILVNNPGDWGNSYAPLQHAHWHGWTPTDLIFPFFLFIVGVSITFAFGENRHSGQTPTIIRRGLTLFALGLFLNLFPRFDFANVRIMGVLQRVGIVYTVCALVYLREYLYRTVIAPPFSDPKLASLAGALTFVTIWAVILWVMYKRRVIVKL
jgi:predicted acyltransferase